MAFDWPTFFDMSSIPWFRATRTNITIKCPFCMDDPSHHLSVSLQGKGWHCWRNNAHSGRSVSDLIQVLLGCSRDQARAIVAQQEVTVKLLDTDFASAINGLLGGQRQVTVTVKSELKLLPEFMSLYASEFARKLFVPYLNERGYRDNALKWLARRYNLHCALNGVFSYRVIIPIYHNGEVVNWTARTITNDRLRYKTLTTDSETAEAQGLPAATLGIKETLFDYDALRQGGEVLVITEGPFDAMRVSFYGGDVILGTCLFGKAISQTQHQLIDELHSQFDRVVLLADADVRWSMFGKFPDWVETVQLPKQVNDPAELDYKHFNDLFK